MAGTCKRCLRPYVHAHTVEVSFPSIQLRMDWEGCADCVHAIKRQMGDFLIRATAPTGKAKRRLQKEQYLRGR